MDIQRLLESLVEEFKTKRNATVFIEDNILKVIYRSTKVAEVYRDGRIKLYSGNFHSATTKSRINDVLLLARLSLGGHLRKGNTPMLSQRDFKWFVVTGKKRESFYEGITINLEK